MSDPGLPDSFTPPFDLVLHLLRALRGDMGEVKTDLREIKERIGLLEGQYASMSPRLDRLGGDMERIKTRLNLHDGALA